MNRSRLGDEQITGDVERTGKRPNSAATEPVKAAQAFDVEIDQAVWLGIVLTHDWIGEGPKNRRETWQVRLPC
jgi:hypothetical protein